MIQQIEENIFFNVESERFHVTINYQHPITRKRAKKRKTFATFGEARAWKSEFKASMKRGQYPRANVKLGEMCELIRSLKADRKTFDDIQRHLDDLLAYWGENFILARIDEIEIMGLVNYLKNRPKKGQHKGRGQLSNQSIDHVLKELRFMLRYARKRRMLDYVPEIRMLGKYNSRTLELTMGHFLEVIQQLPEAPQPHRSMLLMALNTGQRAGDLSSMTWKQVTDKTVMYRSSKTQRENIVAPLLSLTREALITLRDSRDDDSDFIFLNPRTGKPITDIRRMLTTACRRAGVKRFTLHHMRHLATTVLLEFTGGDRDLVMRIIGWSSMEMLDRYGHIGERAIPAFHALENRLSTMSQPFDTPGGAHFGGRRHLGDTHGTNKQEVL